MIFWTFWRSKLFLHPANDLLMYLLPHFFLFFYQNVNPQTFRQLYFCFIWESIFNDICWFCVVLRRRIIDAFSITYIFPRRLSFLTLLYLACVVVSHLSNDFKDLKAECCWLLNNIAEYIMSCVVSKVAGGYL